MDFIMDIDEQLSASSSYDTIISNMKQYMQDYNEILTALNLGWVGVTKDEYYNVANEWQVDCNNLIADIQDFKDTVYESTNTSSDLLSRGEKLKL